MAKSILTDDQWLALFAEELAGVPRVNLGARYGVSKSAINVQAQKRGLTKRQTGAPDHRLRPPGGWPDDLPLPQSPVGMTPCRWRELLARYQAGETPEALSAEYGVSPGSIHSHAAAVGMRKGDAPDAVYNWNNGRDGTGRAFPFNPDDPAATEAAIRECGRAAAFEGRTHDFVQLERARRAALRWCAASRAASGEEADDDAPPAPPIQLRLAQTPPGLLPDGSDWSTWLFLGGFTAEMMAGARSPSPSWGGMSAQGDDRVGNVRAAQDRAAAPHPSVATRQPPSPEGEGEHPSRPQSLALDRIIVALDPTTTVTGDACGIIVAGSRRRADGVREAVILADRSAHGLSPDQWARRAVQAAREFNAGAMVAEVNQGGDMVRAVLKTAGNPLRLREVRATKGKRVRAEPVAALYEQGRVRHAPTDGVPLSALEEELMSFAGEMEGTGSLDRADALVWAVTHLLIDAPEGERGPRVRRL